MLIACLFISFISSIQKLKTGPRFATPNTFEFEYGSKWKALFDMKKQKLEALEREMKLEEDRRMEISEKITSSASL